MLDGVPFGSYRLQRRLARGGMAEVFLARLIGVEGFERRVAIKRILPHLSESEEFRGMFLDEARLAAQLTHPNIVHIYDFGKVDDYYFIAMELVDGVDLGRLIRHAHKKPIPFELCARLLADVCAGLNFAHNAVDALGRRLSVVHRDVTPQNVLITYDGSVKIVDFGIAKAAFAAERTRPGVVKGKYAYMSPEQVEGKNLDGRSDVFSAGICLFELVTGAPLFRRDDVTASMREIRDGKPIVPEKHRHDVPAELVSIMRKALHTARERRYESAAAMQHDLEKFLKSVDALATARELGDYLRRELPRPPEDAAPLARAPQPQGTERQAQGTERQAQGTQQQAQGTQQQAQGTQRQAQGTQQQAQGTQQQAQGTQQQAQGTQQQAQGTQQQARAGERAESSLSLDDATEDVPTHETDGDKIPTRDHDNAPTRPLEMATTPGATTPALTTPETLFPTATTPSGRSATALISPAHSALRTWVAAAAAALTVTALTLVVLRPWTRSREPLIVRVPTPANLPLPALANAQQPGQAQANSQLANPTQQGSAEQGSAQQGSAQQGNAQQGNAQQGNAQQGNAQQGNAQLVNVQAQQGNAPANATLANLQQPERANLQQAERARAQAEQPTLDILSRPAGARVTVDGEALRAATPIHAEAFAAGVHKVTVAKHGYETRELAVRLDDGEHRTLDVELRPVPTRTMARAAQPRGLLTVRTLPWSKVFEGARLLGTTPLANVPLTPGTHTLTFVNPELPPQTRTVDVHAGQEARLSLELKK